MWIESKDEAIASAGWQTYSSMVAIKEVADLDLGEIKSLLRRIARRNTVDVVAESGAAADGGHDAEFPRLSLRVRPPPLSVSVRFPCDAVCR